jgi:tetratricopeptide (TPR) repeat protein
VKRRLVALVVTGFALFGGVAAGAGGPAGIATGVGASADPNKLLKQGVRQALAGDYDSARVSFRRLLAIQPANKYAWFNLGYLAQLRNQSAEATSDYDKSLATDPTYTPAMYNKAIVLEKSNVDAAIVLYRKILTLDSKASATHVRLGLLLDRSGDTAGARREFDAGLAIDPTLRDAVPSGYRSPGS